MERDRTRRETLDDDTLSLFCSQLSLMLQAGIGVEEGAALLAGDADELGQRTLLAGLRAGLDLSLIHNSEPTRRRGIAFSGGGV